MLLVPIELAQELVFTVSSCLYFKIIMSGDILLKSIHIKIMGCQSESPSQNARINDLNRNTSKIAASFFNRFNPILSYLNTLKTVFNFF